MVFNQIRRKEVIKFSKQTILGITIATTLVLGIGAGVGISAGVFSDSNSSGELENSIVNEVNIKRLFSYERKTREDDSYSQLENYPNSGNFPVKLVIEAGPVLDKTFNEQVLDALLDIYGKDNVSSKALPIKQEIVKLYQTETTNRTPKETSSSYVNAIKTLGVETKTVGQESTTLTKKQVVLAPGGRHKDAIELYWKNNKDDNDTKFILSDYYDEENKGLKNTYGFTFDTKTPSFRVGYLTGLFLENIGDTTPTVGIWAGGNFVAITDYMVGFTAGIKYYNETNSSSINDVKIIRFAKDEEFTDSGFAPGGKGRAKADYLISEGVDVILPAAGIQVNDAISAINSSSRKDQIKIIGSDGDWVRTYDKDDQDKNMYITSIYKNLRKAMYEGYKSIAIGTDTNELKNSLVEDDATINWKHFNVGENKNFSGYTKEFSGWAWDFMFEKVDKLEKDFINNQIVFGTKKLVDATWNDALNYIKSL